MLEHIKEGDLVVFTDGSEAIIVGKTKRDSSNMNLFFDICGAVPSPPNNPAINSRTTLLGQSSSNKNSGNVVA